MTYTSAPTVSSSSRAHIPALDGLRGLAILLVLMAHLYVPASVKLRAVANAGWIGVDLFFVLSGFLITGILLEAKGQPGYFRQFYARRARRIFPIYYLALVLGIFVLPAVPSIVRLRELQIWFWTYTVNVAQAVHGLRGMPEFWAIYWSLAVEEQFYLLWPLVVLLAGTATLRRLCLMGIAGAWLLRPALVAWGVPGDVIYVQLFTRMDALLAGAWVATWRHDGRALSVQWGRLAGGVAAGGVLLIGVWRGGFESDDPMVSVLGFSLVTVGGAGLLVLGLMGDAKPLEWRALRFWAPYSYGLYVWHRIATAYLPWPRWHGHAGTLGLFGLKVAVTLTVAMVSWHVFERWWLQAGRATAPARDLLHAGPAQVPSGRG